MKLPHLTRTLMLVTGLMLSTIIMHEVHISAWPVFLAVIFFFAHGFDTSKIKTIMLGGAVGLILGYGLSIFLPLSIELFGSSVGYYLVIAVTLFIVIIMGPIAHDWFNYVGFCYALLCLLFLSQVQENIGYWMGTHLVFGSLLIGTMYLVVYKLWPRLGLSPVAANDH